jgi:AhpD family alkylhydroperoxidase
MRASQVNGCAFCLHMHTDQALRHGETPQRLTALDAWEESPLFTDKERAALAWTEEVTLVADSGASKPAYDTLKAHFSEEEIGWLILAIVQINSWNRLAISTRSQYDPKMFGQQAQAEKAREPA